MKNQKIIMTEIEKNKILEVTDKLYAVSKIFADTKKQMKISEFKTLALALSQIDWTQKCPEKITMDKKTLAQVIGINSDSKHLSQNLKREIQDITKHSFIEFDKGADDYKNGHFIRFLEIKRNEVILTFETEYLKLFGELEKNYITLYLNDCFKLKTERAYLFYELLRKNIKKLPTDYGFLEVPISIENLKKILNIDKEAYINKVGSFDTRNFEKKILIPICENLLETTMIKMRKADNKNYFERIHENRKTTEYRFYFTFEKNPKTTSEITKQMLEQMSNPEEIKKIKKQLDKTREKINKNNKFYFENQNNYDMDEYEKNILNN